MLKQLIPTLLCDFYKVSHRKMYPDKTETVYSTWTPRTTRIPDISGVVVFGIQAFIKKYLMGYFQAHFFNRPKEEVIAEYERYIRHTLFVEPDSSHIAELHDLGYLPLEIKALPEGSICPIRVPYLTVWNTHKNFAWLTNYIETLASMELWQPATVATIAHKYRKMLDNFAKWTGGSKEFVPFQGHDFSMRGKDGLESAATSQLGHLLSFVGTDTIPAIMAAEMYYNANIETELVGTSIPATEHSIQCAYGDDMAYFRRLINEVHPTGMVSIVSDGYDFWGVISEVLPALKDEIMARDGKVVIRPDSGDPVDIVCGTNVDLGPAGKTIHNSPNQKGAVECLWDIFGGTVNEKGYKELDSHIGLIYGDAITFERATEICKKLEAKGFASTNIVFGIGSFTYQYMTRDTLGFALKTTFTVCDGQPKMIFKDPKTDDGTKKSLKGRVVIMNDGTNSFKAVDQLDHLGDIDGDKLVTVFRDGQLLVDATLAEIRERLTNQ